MSTSGAYGPAATIFTEELKYTKKPKAADGEIRTQVVPAFNKSTFSPSEVMMFTVPTRRPNQVLNSRQSFLKFKLNNLDANTIAVDYTADSIIESLDVWHGSQHLESIRGYNALACIVKDYQGSKNVQSMLEGEHETTARTGATVAASGGSINVCIPLISGLIGTMSAFMLPTYALTNSDLRVEITLASSATGVVHDTAESTYTVSDPALHLEYVQLSPAAIAKLPKAIEFGFESFANVAATVPSSTANEMTLVPFSLSSAKAFYSAWRHTTNMTSPTAKTVSNRVWPEASELAYQIGGILYPQAPLRSVEECAASTLKAHHALGVVDEVMNIKRSQYTNTASGAADSAFVLGIDLEWIFSARARSGVDLKGKDVFLVSKWDSPTSQAFRLDTWCHHDCVLKIDQGQAYKSD
jgi:hypothetical protein